MLALTLDIQNHLSQNVQTLAVCWRIRRTDNVLILGTELDRDITITASYDYDIAGTYLAQAGIIGSDVKSTDDMSVDNMEVEGSLPASGELSVIDLSAADIEAGLFDGAEVALFLVNWEAPDDGVIMLRTGTLGEIRRTSDGRYRTELRGLTQKLSQTIIRTYGSSCDAELGDSRCTIDLTSYTRTGTVTSIVTSTRQFVATISGAPVEDLMNGGLVTWTSGDNVGFSMEVKQVVGNDEVILYLPMPLDIQVGDTFSVRPGCDKSPAMCKGRFNNLVNFRGHGAWVPGIGEMSVFGGQTTERKPRAESFLQWPRPAEVYEP